MTSAFRHIAEKFNPFARAPEPDDKPMRDVMRYKFGDDLDNTVARMSEALDAMGLPLPKRGAVIHGSEGVLMFLDQYGIMLRLEVTDDLLFAGERINDHPMVLQPLGQRNITPYAVLEICPGVHVTKDKGVGRLLFEKMPETGVDVWDSQLCNTGLLPLRLPQFPEGVPVVLDRLAVEKLTDKVKPVRDALEVFGLRDDPQRMYEGLRKSFAAAWPEGAPTPDREKFQAFLQECLRQKALGYLVSGWMRDPKAGPNDWMYEDTKRGMAADAGQAYARQMKPD